MKRINKMAMILMVTLLMVNPVPSKAFVFVLPPVIEGSVALLSSVEAAMTTLATGSLAYSGRESLRQSGKYIAKKGVDSYVKPLIAKQLAGNLGVNKEMLKNIRFSKIIFSSSYVPKVGKQLLYYISLNHGGKKYYKIGITKNSLKKRYRREYHSAKIDSVLMLEMPIKSAQVIETAIKATFFKERCDNRAILAKDGGYSEVYRRDILQMDGIILNVIKWME